MQERKNSVKVFFFEKTMSNVEQCNIYVSLKSEVRQIKEISFSTTVIKHTVDALCIVQGEMQ